MSQAFLATYRPLCQTAHGRRAIADYGLPPFIDASCRREPDLQSSFPTISGLCRAGRFAPRLHEGDHVAYITKKGTYPPLSAGHWRLTALLRVAHRLSSHDEAAAWFTHRSLPLPRNCMVKGSTPATFGQTDGLLRPELRERTAGLPDEEKIRIWDAIYRSRANEYPVFLVCEALFVNVVAPPVIGEHDWVAWIGRVPSTLTPPRIATALWNKLTEVASKGGL